MAENRIQLEGKLVGQIEGEFYVPSYQRGYRWEKSQVEALLDDAFENGERPYCLQPIVVRKDERGRYELIDGQQRLTTLYIIYKYMTNRWPEYIENVRYSLVYETREENEQFFRNIDDEKRANENIDFFFIHKAYKTVEQWFAKERKMKPLHVAGDLTKFFDKNVWVIWYELQEGTQENAIKLFTRLNIGRIPLTNAELVKALFLSRSKEDKTTIADRQQEIAFQWDTIEKELHDTDFWYFLTKKSTKGYPTKIEILLDFMAGKTDDVREQFYTFLFFNKRKGDLLGLWNKILRYYYRLKECYKCDTLYHKMGYLVASGTFTIGQMMDATEFMRKSEMENYLDEAIKDSVKSDKPYGELTYEKDYEKITNILLLFNVVSLMSNQSGARFPFKSFNDLGDDRWSLEHIHAQHSLKLKTQGQWKEWLRLHQQSILSLKHHLTEELRIAETDRLIGDIDVACEDEHLSEVTFTDLSMRVIDMLSQKGEASEYVHSIANMALLQKSKNSLLNNSLFDVKRRKIISMDAKGQFIPYCTKMVFMKYYSSERQDNVSFHFWGEADRVAYIAKMNEILKDYLKEKIKYGNE